FKIYSHAKVPLLDPRNKEGFSELTTLVHVEDDKPFYLQPGEFVLGVTKEKIKVPNDLVVRVEGRSSLGRLGIIVHSTAGFVDPGFEGTITLEISNLNRLPIALYPGMRIGQYAFELMTGECDVPYYMKESSKYQNQELPEESRVTDDPEFN
ncbi:MAG: dCTP deaminase, partial [Candidatus Heimdallarchaeaceae archaeon]